MNLDFLATRMGQITESGAWIGPLTALVAAFVFGQILAWTYERTYRGLSYSRGFSHTVVLVCIAASILVLAMQFSLLAGLGLFGVLSMIRFRTDLKTPRDLVFIMGSACIGVASGVGALLEATLGTVTFCLVAIYLAAGPFGARTRFDGVLRFRLPASTDFESTLQQLLREYCRRRVLLSTTDLGQGDIIEHVYQVKFFRSRDRNALLTALRQDLDARETRLMLQDSTAEY
jgi:hypothetical protein